MKVPWPAAGSRRSSPSGSGHSQWYCPSAPSGRARGRRSAAAMPVSSTVTRTSRAAAPAGADGSGPDGTALLRRRPVAWSSLACIGDACIGDACIGDACIGDACIGDACIGDACIGEQRVHRRGVHRRAREAAPAQRRVRAAATTAAAVGEHHVVRLGEHPLHPKLLHRSSGRPSLRSARPAPKAVEPSGAEALRPGTAAPVPRACRRTSPGRAPDPALPRRRPRTAGRRTRRDRVRTRPCRPSPSARRPGDLAHELAPPAPAHVTWSHGATLPLGRLGKDPIRTGSGRRQASAWPACRAAPYAASTQVVPGPIEHMVALDLIVRVEDEAGGVQDGLRLAVEDGWPPPTAHRPPGCGRRR